MYFWTCGIRQTWLDKCLRSPVWEDSSTSNMVNGPKRCWNMKESTFTVFIDPCEVNSGWKCVSERYAKSWDFFLTHWQQITGILFLREALYSNIFRCNYLKNEKCFLNSFLHFLNLDRIWKFSEKNGLHCWCIFEYTDSKKRG